MEEEEDVKVGVHHCQFHWPCYFANYIRRSVEQLTAEYQKQIAELEERRDIEATEWWWVTGFG